MAKPTDRKIEKLGLVNLKYGTRFIPNMGVVKMTLIWEDGEEGFPYYTIQKIEELGIPADKIRLYPRAGMDTDFEKTIKPLFEGEELEMTLYSKKKNKHYQALLSFDATVYGKNKEGKKNFHQGDLVMSFPKRGELQWPMQSAGHADVLFDNQLHEGVEIFYVTPDSNKNFYTFELGDRPKGKTRLYIDNAAGLVNDFETVVKPLLAGKEVTSNPIKSAKGNEYQWAYQFDANAVPPYIDDPDNTPYYGNLARDFAN